MDDLLRLRGLVKRFGGLAAADGVDLAVQAGEVHALIGPNGAGKTTLVHLISGALRPDAGCITFAGKEVTRVPMHERVRRGLVRSYQVTSIFRRLSVLDNAALAVQAAAGSSMRFWGRCKHDAGIERDAHALLAQVGMEARAHVVAGTLAHGEQRTLEVALAMAVRPRLLLLDEPMAGTGREETARLIAVLKKLKGRFAIMLVEHDMTAVFALADRISVMIYGHIVASGTPDAVRADPQVVAAYLGDEME